MDEANLSRRAERSPVPNFADPQPPRIESARPVPPVLRKFLTEYDAEVAQAEVEGRPAPYQVGLLMVDLDYLKEVNETWGHKPGGDVLIAQTKKVIRSTIRRVQRRRSRVQGELAEPMEEQRQGVIDEDADLQDALLKHVHGDEFLVLLRIRRGVEGQEAVNAAAARLQARLKTHKVRLLAPTGIEVSIGGKLYEGETPEELYNIADQLMDRNKKERKWKELLSYPPDVREDILAARGIAARLRRRGISTRRLASLISAAEYAIATGKGAVIGLPTIYLQETEEET